MPHLAKSTPLLLSIAGSDCSGGAGLQADIKTAGAFGVFAATVVTAVTAQNAGVLSDVFVLPVPQVLAQLEAIYSGYKISAIKLGMLGNPDVAMTVAAFLRQIRAELPAMPIVIDPVIKATSGGSLSTENTLAVYRDELMPLASLLTPNVPEAALLLDLAPAQTHAELEQQAEQLRAGGAAAVLLKGGHFFGDNSHLHQLATDILCCDQGIFPFSSPRLHNVQSHGGGCTLATAVAAGLAQGLSLRQAVAAAKSFMQGALANSQRLQLAPVNGPIHHFYSLW